MCIMLSLMVDLPSKNCICQRPATPLQYLIALLLFLLTMISGLKLGIASQNLSI
ncbi:hypothetical protein POUND7_001401 [Theobroma cacao]